MHVQLDCCMHDLFPFFARLKSSYEVAITPKIKINIYIYKDVIATYMLISSYGGEVLFLFLWFSKWTGL